MRSLSLALGISLWAGLAAAQGAPTHSEHHSVVVQPSEVAWSPGPASLAKGAKAAVLEGDPKAEGPFTMRLSLPDGFRIAPHSHPAVERITIIKGTFRLGTGDKFDASALKSLPAGAFAAMQPNTNHFVQVQGDTEVQLNGMGPWKITYVNPADDPRKATP